MEQPLSILMPIHSFEPGGVERVGLNLARSWHEAGHKVVVLLGRDEGADRANAPRLHYERRHTRMRTGPFESLWLTWCLLLYLRRHRPDVIFCAGNTYAVVCAVARLFYGPQCPPIVVKVSNDLERRDKPKLSRAAYHTWLRVQGLMFDRFVAIAAPGRAEIMHHMAVGPHRTAMVPDPALTTRRLQALMAIPRSEARGMDVRFVAVGRLVPQKNFALLLEAFARGARSGDTLTIVGDGPQRAKLEAQAVHYGIERQVRFIGHVADPDPYLARADCMVLSSDYEGVPAVVIEAIAAGLPVISTDCSASMRELLAGRGVLVPVGDVDGLARWMTDALSLPIATRETRNYAADFVIEESRDKYIAIMREAIDIARNDLSVFTPSTMRKCHIRGV